MPSNAQDVTERGAPISVIGTGRSGTTLLRRMLCAHPRIYITHEASFYLLEMYRQGAPRREYLEYFFQMPTFRWLGVDPARVLAGLPDPLPPERIGEAYAAIMREKAAQYGRPRFGDKTPHNTGYLARIFEDFPDARVVHIVRDPRATAVSLSRMPWACASLYFNAVCCEIDRQQVEKWKHRVLQIRLEDLLTDPKVTMQRVLDFVGEPWDEAVLDHARHAPRDNDMPPFPWFESATGDRGAPEKQWASLSPAQLRMIEHKARRVMEQFDYAPAKLEQEPSRLARWWAGMLEIPAAISCFIVWFLIYQKMKNPGFIDTEEFNVLFHKVNPRAWARYPGFDRLPAPPKLLAGAPSRGEAGNASHSRNEPADLGAGAPGN